MKFDVSKIRPGWSLSKLSAFGCPLRFARRYIENRDEPAGEAALVGRLVAAALAQIRLTWFQHGADQRIAMSYEPAIRKEIQEEHEDLAKKGLPTCYTEEHVQKAMEIVQSSCKIPSMLPPLKSIASYWIEERLAFSRSWERLRFKPGDEKWWGSRDQREKTWFRYIHDLAYVDTDGVGHVHDDKSLSWQEQDPAQVQAGAFLLFQMDPKVETVRMQYNRMGPGKVQEVPPVSRQDVASFPKWLDAQVSTILGTEDFLPVLGKSCGYCGFKDECPAITKTAGELATIKPDAFRVPQTVEEIQAGGLWLLAAQEAVTIAKKCLEEGMRGLNASSVVLPGTGKELRWNPSSEWEAGAREALNAMVPHVETVVGEDPDAIRAAILGNFAFRKSQVEAVATKLWPLAGKGITAEVKQANRETREAFLEDVMKAGTEKPHKPTFGLFAEKEAA